MSQQMAPNADTDRRKTDKTLQMCSSSRDTAFARIERRAVEIRSGIRLSKISKKRDRIRN